MLNRWRIPIRTAKLIDALAEDEADTILSPVVLIPQAEIGSATRIFGVWIGSISRLPS